MADVLEYLDLPYPPQHIWDVLGDFADIARWAPAINGQTTHDDPGGRIRTLPVGPDRTISEQETARTDLSYSYRMLGRPEGSEYRSTFAVVPLDATTTRVLQFLHVTDPAASEEDLTARNTKLARGNLKSVARVLAAGA